MNSTAASPAPSPFPFPHEPLTACALDGAAAPSIPADADADAASIDKESALSPGNDDPTKLTREEKRAGICLFLSDRITERGHPERGALDAAGKKFGYAKESVRGIWRRHKDAILFPDKYKLDVTRKKGTGCTGKYTASQIRAAVRKVPCQYRHSIRSLSRQTGIPSSTLHRYLNLDEKGTDEMDKGKEGERRGCKRGREVPQQTTAAAASSAVQNEMRLNKLRTELKRRYEKETAAAVKEARREALEEHKIKTQQLRDELSIQQRLQREKDDAIGRLREEMRRHQLELDRLKGELDMIQSGCVD